MVKFKPFAKGVRRDTGNARLRRLPDPSRYDRDFLPRSVAIAAVAVGGYYMVWRAGWTLNIHALWLALPLFLAEAHGYLTFLLNVFMSWDPVEAKRGAQPSRATVDFFIPTFNEPFEVLAPTVAAALAIRHPHETYVLDDGRRPWVRRMCRRLGAQYTTREDNRGAKAGNINNALRHTRGDFVAIVDADFVPSASYIDELLCYFADPKVAVVQGPQEFYNLDSFQHLIDDSDAWHEQAMFFRLIQLGKNRRNAAFWCGSPSMLRREAVEAVGGIREETITEDLHTSMRLHAAGWKSVFHPGIIALGVAPNDYNGFIMQRLRWAQGAMQVIRREWRLRGLTWAQRLNYVASTGTYFDSVRKGVYLLIIPAVILTDTLPVTASAGAFIGFWAAQFFLASLANKLLGRGHYRYLPTEFFDLLKMWAFIGATRTLFSGKRLTFKVTPKGKSDDRQLHPMLAPHVIVIGAYVLSVSVGVVRTIHLGPFSTGNEGAMIAATFWAGAVLAILSSVVVYGYRQISKRSAERVPVSINCSWRRKYSPVERPATLRNLTALGCSVRLSDPLAVGDEIRLNIRSEELHLSGQVANVVEEDGTYVTGVKFDPGGRAPAQLAGLIARSILDRHGLASGHAVPPPRPIRETRELQGAA